MSVTRLSLRAMPAMALALLSAACTHDATGDAGASLEDSVQPRSRVMALAPDGTTRRAPIAPAAIHPRYVSLPGEAGAAGTPRSRDYADGFRQDIALQGARVPLVTNGMTLLARSDTRETLEERTPLYKPSEGAIRSEIGAAMPHVAMQIVERERANDYGPYGLALGRVGADTRCMYMWQWIDSNRLPRDSGLAGPVSVRVRLCSAGTTFDAMGSWADHLVIGPQDGPAVVADAGADATRVLPIADEKADETPRDIPPKAPRRAGRRRLAEHRRHHRVAVAERDAAPSDDLAAPAPAPEGPRYLTTSAVPAAAVRAQPIVVAPPAPATAPHFSGDLPPEAFAGPKTH